MKINESTLKQIIKESVNNVLKESFNNNELSQAIKEHGGLSKMRDYMGAPYHSNYDLQNATYKGYLSSKTIEELVSTPLFLKIQSWLLLTNDGGAIVVGETYSYEKNSAWNEKVKKRNQEWGEDGPNKDDFQVGKWRWETQNAGVLPPKEVNTFVRRSERRNNKRKK